MCEEGENRKIAVLVETDLQKEATKKVGKVSVMNTLEREARRKTAKQVLQVIPSKLPSSNVKRITRVHIILQLVGINNTHAKYVNRRIR